jgi:FG-GAP-like repeat/ASPIC and UnbV
MLAALVLLAPPLPGQEKREVSENTRKMWEIFRERTSTIDPEELAFLLNDQIAERLRERLKDTPPQQLDSLREKFALELLRGGKTQEAIDQLTDLLRSQATGAQPTPRTLRLKQMLGLSWLRLGEERNCVLNHTTRSCIVPIQGAGIYQDKEATLKAKQVLTEVVRAIPQALVSRWLLNVASMTLGEYPDGLPEDLRIPLPMPRHPGSFPVFTDVAASLGLGRNEYAGGSSLEDFDNDGDIDVFMDSEGFTHACHYFRNNGDGTFTDRTHQSGLWGELGGRVTATADYNNDGFVDIFVCRGAWMATERHHLPNTLLRNNGDGTFDNVTIEAGLVSYHPTSHAAWGDYDNDGWVDLFVCNESQRPQNHPHPCELYRNNGDGTFSECAKASGVDVLGFIKSASWGDYDKDGFLDLYVSDLAGPNLLFKSAGSQRAPGEPWFRNVAAETKTTEPIQSFPSFFFDFDNDGWLDIYVSAFPPPEVGVSEMVKGYLGQHVDPIALPRLYQNNRDGTFRDAGAAAGLDFPVYAMSASYGDADNDGYPDIYSGTGHLDQQYIIPKVMVRNVDGTKFDNVTIPSGLGHLQKGHGISFGDIDNDGDLDILTVMGGSYTTDLFFRALFLNGGNKNAWVNLKLVGTKCNRAALNSTIHIVANTPKGKRHIRAMIANQGSFASSPMQKIIGLGNATSIESVEVFWQGSNTTQRFGTLKPNRAYTLTEGEAAAKPRPYKPIKIEAAEGHKHPH